MTSENPWQHQLRIELRDATRELHTRLDSNPVLFPLQSSTITLAEYQQALQALYPINAATEASIGEYIQNRYLPFDFDSWRRTSELARDLAYYEIQPAATAWPGPTITSDGEVVGCLYVLAGSAIGGRAILKNVNEVLGVTPDTGGRFFHGYGKEFPALWKRFWQAAAEHCPPDQAAAATGSATDLFQSYLDQLDGIAN